MIACPSRAKWQAVLAEDLPQPEEAAMNQHALDCKSCQEVLETLIRPAEMSLARLAQADLETPLPNAGFLETPFPAHAHDPFRSIGVQEAPEKTKKGPDIPGYEILEELGRGGMGVVFKARHVELNRLVALKVLRDSILADAATLARFRDEARVLAALQHPGIVQIHEVGTLEGCPYLALEYVPGRSLERWLQGTPQPPRDAAALMVPMAQAIHAAHLQGVIHRDLKPANILLAQKSQEPNHKSQTNSNDKKPNTKLGGVSDLEYVWDLSLGICHFSPKVTDFGLAKPLDNDAQRTETGVVVGTPSYMAPEQASGQRNVGPAVDIYALGAILYEMLTGQPPFKEVTAHDTLHAVLTEEPVPPRRLQPQIPADLETICLKCLEKDPAKRYLTAANLAAELERFLEGRPILARPVGRMERLTKWCRRYPAIAALLLVSTLAALLASGLAAWAFSAERQATAERDERDRQKLRAEANETKALRAVAAEKQAHTLSQQRLAQIEKSNDIITAIFNDLDIRQVKAGSEPLEAVLAARLVKAASQLEGEAVGDPLVVARLQDRLGMSLLSLGRERDAIPLLVKARATRSALLGTDHLDTLTTMVNLAMAYQAAGQSERSLPLLEQALPLLKAGYGADHIITNAAMNNLASLYWSTGKHALAVPLYEECLRLRTAALGADHADTLTARNNLATAYWTVGKRELALPLFAENLTLLRATLGDEHPHTLSSMNNLAGAYWGMGKLELALPLFEETLRLKKAKLGSDHPDTLLSMNNLGMGHHKLRQFQKALPHFREAAEVMEKRRFQHAYASQIVNNLVDTLDHLRQFAQAETWQRKWLAAIKEQSGVDTLPYANAAGVLGYLLHKQQKWADAEPVWRECLAFRDRKQPELWSTFVTKALLGAALLGQQKYAEAEPLLLAGYEGMKQREKMIPPQGKVYIAETLDRLVQLYGTLGKKEEAAKWRAEREAVGTAHGKPAAK